MGLIDAKAERREIRAKIPEQISNKFKGECMEKQKQVEKHEFSDPSLNDNPFGVAFEESDTPQSGGYFLPPEGKYVGVIGVQKDGTISVFGDSDQGRVRFGLAITEGRLKGRWVFGDVQTRNPNEDAAIGVNITPEGAKTRLRILSQTTKAFANGAGIEVTFKDKAGWSTADLTEYTEEIIKQGKAHPVSFTVRHGFKKDGQPDLITKGKNEGEQKYKVYVNGPAKEA